jgi:hypothetical protein
MGHRVSEVENKLDALLNQQLSDPGEQKHRIRFLPHPTDLRLSSTLEALLK